MTDPAWFMGVGVNAIIGITSTIALILALRKQYYESIPWRKSTSGYLAILGIIITSFGTLALYLQMGFIQNDLTEADTLLPPLLWLGYYITSVSFLRIILDLVETTPFRRDLIVCISILVFAISGLGLLNYTIHWNDGAVIVYFSNTVADMLGTGQAICIGIFAFSIAVIKRLEFIGGEDNLETVPSPRGIYLGLMRQVLSIELQ